LLALHSELRNAGTFSTLDSFQLPSHEVKHLLLRLDLVPSESQGFLQSCLLLGTRQYPRNSEDRKETGALSLQGKWDTVTRQSLHTAVAKSSAEKVVNIRQCVRYFSLCAFVFFLFLPLVPQGASGYLSCPLQMSIIALPGGIIVVLYVEESGVKCRSQDE